MANGEAGALAGLSRITGAILLPADLSRLFAALRRQALADRIRWPLWLPAALAAGVGLYFALPVEPEWSWAVGAAGLALSAGGASLALGSTRWRIAFALLAAVALGFCVGKTRTEVVR